MTFGLEMKRLRAAEVADPYNGRRTVPDWENPDELAFCGFIASQSSAMTPDGSREENVSTSMLTVEDAGIDIRRGDRIVFGGRTFVVDGVPETDANPFTGWRPTMQVRLQEVLG